jgi:hypothetical protein
VDRERKLHQIDGPAFPKSREVPRSENQNRNHGRAVRTVLTPMSESYRHHRATREIVIVPVPCAAVDFARQVKPGKYPRQERQPWPLRQPFPRSPSKAETLRRFLDQVSKQDREIMAYMKRAREGVRHAAE